jgi:hypothetical protein
VAKAHTRPGAQKRQLSHQQQQNNNTTPPAKTTQAPPHNPARKRYAPSSYDSRSQSSNCFLQKNNSVSTIFGHNTLNPDEKVWEIRQRPVTAELARSHEMLASQATGVLLCNQTHACWQLRCDPSISPRATRSLKRMLLGVGATVRSWCRVLV